MANRALVHSGSAFCPFTLKMLAQKGLRMQVPTYMMSSHETMNTGYSCRLSRANGSWCDEAELRMCSRQQRPYGEKKVEAIRPSAPSAALPRRETSRPDDSCWNQLLKAAFSRDHLWIFSVWLLIRSSQGSLLRDSSAPLHLWLTVWEFGRGTAIQKGSRDDRSSSSPSVKASRLREKAQGLAKGSRKENHLASLAFPSELLTVSRWNWHEWLTDSSGVKSWGSLIGCKI